LKYIFAAILLFPFISYAQINTEPFSEELSDSLQKQFEENSLKIDTLNLTVSNIIVTGNKVTKDEIITREMLLKKGSKFTLEKYSKDLLSIYNLALFTKVDIIPIPDGEKEIALNVDVQERWYILPRPGAGIEEGEWKKLWVSMGIRWDNFRGRNESLNARFRLFYNPSVSVDYFVPWVGEKLHMFIGIGGAWERNRNKSLIAVGKGNGSNTIAYNDVNYENIQYKAELKLGRYFGRYFSVFTDLAYNHIRVTQYIPGRTLSPDGVDKYMVVGGGLSFDSRDIYEFATKGLNSRIMYHRSGLLNREVDFGRFTIDNESFIPVTIKNKYYITLASKLYTSVSMGPRIPVYDHKYLGYSDDYIRGWKGKAYEGDNIFTIYNEIRIPILTPRYIKGKDMMIVKDLPIIKNLDLRHALYFTLIYDIGTVWYKDEKLKDKRFSSGAGIGLNLIAPFGYIVRADWVFRIARPSVGQFGLTLSAKF